MTRHQVAQLVGRGVADEGATAVVLVGSVVRGDDHAHSDIDLIAIGEGPRYRLHVVDDELVSISWRSTDAIRASFTDPCTAGGAVPAWRSAVILHDPRGSAAALQAEAQAWTWDQVGDAADRWVADHVTGDAEEVHKLVANIDKAPLVAGVQRSLLSTHLPTVMSVHHRLEYDTEDHLPALVNERMGEEWRRAHADSIGCSGVGHRDGCVAALTLYRLAAAAVRPQLGTEQRAVADRAVARAMQAP